MTLSNALTNAYSGLAASSLRANVTANNIANANTPGYVRRDVALGENRVAGQGNGVIVNGITRAQDLALSHERRQAEASTGRADIIARSLNEINAALGEPEDGFGLFASYQNLEQALQALTVTPESPALQVDLFSTINQLGTQFNTLSSLGQKQRTDADRAINEAVKKLNNALAQVENLNGDIAGLNEGTGEAVALEDQRQRVIDEISQLIPVRQLRQSGGRIDLITNEGVFLLAGTARPISFTQAGVIPTGAQYANGTGSLSGLAVGEQNITPGSSSNLAVQTGVLSGFFDVRDNTAPAFVQRLDALAADLINLFSAEGLDPTTPFGVPGLFTDRGQGLDPTQTTGIARRLSINPALDPAQGGEISRLRDGLGATQNGPAGDASILTNLLTAFTDQRNAPTDTGLTGKFSATEAVAGVTSIIGQARVRADAVLFSAAARANVLSDTELAKSGVDTDRELQSLLLIEQAYAANARVIQTVSDMINRLLEL